MFGRLNGSNDCMMVKVDYSTVLTRKCAHADFENWSPSGALAVRMPLCIVWHFNKICVCLYLIDSPDILNQSNIL